MGNFTRTDRTHDDWHRAVYLARTYAYQLNRRFRVRGIRHANGWLWKVERIRGKRLHP